jgi:integrase
MKILKWLQERNDNNRYNKDIMTRLDRYVFPFFKDKDIESWARNENQRGWLDYLEDLGLSVSTIQICRNAANLFLRCNAELSDGKLVYTTLKLTLPNLTSKRKYKIELARKNVMNPLQVTKMEGQYINDMDVKFMLENCNSYLNSLIWVSYYYGLRLSECLAAVEGDYRNDYLLVSEQAASQYTNKCLKGVLSRKVPHFNLTNDTKKETFKHIKTIIDNRVNPTSVSRDFGKLMKKLGMNYRFHDLRGTWITNLSLDDVNTELIRQAAGHQDMTTTQKYLRDPHVSEEGNKQFGG